MLKPLCFLFILFSFVSPKPSNKTELSITIRNLSSNQGKVLFALYDSKKDFLDEKKAVHLKVASIKGNVATIKINSLPFGKYAFAVYHDKNNNSKLDKNMFGIPKEDYAFSNNAKATFGPPSFEASAFKLYKSKQKISLSIR